MDPDDFLLRLEALDHTCAELEERLNDLRHALILVRRLRLDGQSVSEILGSGPGLPARRQVQESVSRLNEALHAYRVQAVRTVVEVEGLSIAETARLTDNARQVISRLYHDDDGGPGS